MCALKRGKLVLPKNSCVIKQRKFLFKLAKTLNSPAKTSVLLKKAKTNELKALKEISRNLLLRNLPLTRSSIRKLSTHKTLFRKLANSQSPRQTLIQQNQKGGLPFLLPLLAPILGGLLSVGLERAIR